MCLSCLCEVKVGHEVCEAVRLYNVTVMVCGKFAPESTLL